MTVKTLAAALAAVAMLIAISVDRLRDEHNATPIGEAATGTPYAANAKPAAADREADADESARTFTDRVYAGEAENIGGYLLRKDRTCDAEIVTLPNVDGTAIEALRCTPRALAQRPYEHYDAASLRQMAYGDPEAAAELGYRLIDAQPAEGTKYLLRAVALDPDYVNEIETIRHAVYPPEVNVDNQLELAAGSYVFALLRARIDSDYEQMLDIADAHFRDSGGTDEQRAVLEARAAELYEYMRNTRLEVVGDRVLGVSP